MEVAALQRDEAQAQYQHHIDRVKAHGETRAKAGERLNVFGAPQETGGLHTPNESEHAIANPQMEGSLAEFELEESAPGATSTIQTYLNSVDPYKRAAAVAELARSNARDAFDLIAKCFDDHSSHVRNAVVRGLLKVDPARTIELFNRVLEEGTEDRRRKIGNAIAA